MTQQQPDPWTPPTGGSNLFSPSNHVGAVCLFAVRAFHPQLQGSFGARDAVEVGVDVISEPRAPEMAGQRFDTALIYGVALVDEFRDKIGQYVLGRLMAKPTRNPQPVIVLEPATDAEQQMARQHVQQHGLPSLDAQPAGQVQQANNQHAQAFQQQYGQQQPQQQSQPYYAYQQGQQQGQQGPGGPGGSPAPGPSTPGAGQPAYGQPAPWSTPGQPEQPPF